MKSDDETAVTQLTILQVLRRYPGYRRLWQSRVCSLLGDWFNILALFSMLREIGGNSPIIIGFLYIVKLLPMLVMSPIAGVFADRFNRATILILSDLIRCCLVLCFLAVPFFPEQGTALTLLLVLCQACVSAFFEPAKMAMMPTLVPTNGLLSANALGAITWSVCYALGTAMGGLLTNLFGWRVVIGLDALSYVASAVLIVRIGYRSLPRKTVGHVDLKHLLGIADMLAGYRYLKTHPRTTYILFFKTALATAGATEAILTLLGERFYHWGGRPDLGIGLLLAARALGSGVGPIVGRRFVKGNTEAMRRWMLAGFAFAAVAYLCLALVRDPVSAMVFAFLGAFGSGVVWVFSSAILQVLTPEAFRGRVFSVELGLAMATMAASIFCFTRLADLALFPLTWLPAGLGVLLLCAGTLLWLVGRRLPGFDDC